MGGDRFLEGYDGQTTEQLLAMENEYRIDSLVLAFEDAFAWIKANRGSIRVGTSGRP
jgi:hypothetical protein